MTVFSKSYISYGVKVLCAVCVLSNNRSVVGTSISRTQKSAKSTASEYTQEVLRVKCEFIIFPGKFFLYEQTDGHCVRS